MPELLELEVATPERMLVKEQVAEVQIPARDGYVGVLPGHAPLLAELSTGFMYYTAGSRKWYLAIHGGFVEVNNDHVRVLANMAERAEEIDVERVRQDLRRAQEQLATGLGADPAFALDEIASAEARLHAAEHK
jgi:F-type H+-transporting ATPase subunit epsilon